MPAVVVAVAMVLVAFGWSTWRSLAPPARVEGLASLRDPAGHAFGGRADAGRYKLLVFGYTSCPDICPTTLAKLHAVLAALGAEGDAVTPVFVTVDPENDTPDRLAAYSAAFDARIVPLTGTRAQLAVAARAVNDPTADALARPGEAQRRHTGMIYLLGRDGRVLASYSPLQAAQEIATDVRVRFASSTQG